jgi:hypothetical protein
LTSRQLRPAVDKLGAVRVNAADPSGRQMWEIHRLVARVHPGRRRGRVMAWVALVAIVGSVVVGDRRDDGMPGALLLILGLVAGYAALRTTDRGWAWAAARRWTRTWPPGPWQIRVDPAGIECAIADQSYSHGWSQVTEVVEGDAAIVFVTGATRRGVRFVSVPGEQLSSTDRASIRRWAETAPGDRPWTTIPGPRPPRRLRVSSTPG